ncbi:unnamed protein product [Prunus brigantina]
MCCVFKQDPSRSSSSYSHFSRSSNLQLKRKTSKGTGKENFLYQLCKDGRRSYFW